MTINFSEFKCLDLDYIDSLVGIPEDPIAQAVRDFSDKYIRAKRLKEIAEELNFDEKELERFEKSREGA